MTLNEIFQTLKSLSKADLNSVKEYLESLELNFNGFEDFVLNHPELTFVIASGRQYYNILAQFPLASSKMVYIAENGGLVFKDDKCLYSNRSTQC